MTSYGLISNVQEKTLHHTCNTDQGSSGSPILSIKIIN